MRGDRGGLAAAALLLGLLAAGCEGGGDSRPDLVDTADARDASETTAPDAPDAPGAPLLAAATAPAYAVVGAQLTLDGSPSTGAALYLWDFGDGRAWDTPRESPLATVAYPTPGRYKPVLTAIAPGGQRRTAQVSVAVTRPLVFAPLHSSTVAWLPGTERAAVVSHDASELTVVQRDGAAFSVVTRLSAPGGPRTLTPWGDRLLVPCPDDDLLRILDPSGAASPIAVPLPRGSRPYAALPVGPYLAVSLQGTGQLALLTASDSPALHSLIGDLPDARGLALLPDGRLAVTRWRSPDA
ncbi:MAG: PKD domain-containing protein, partial [Myxococcota bacterium]